MTPMEDGTVCRKEGFLSKFGKPLLLVLIIGTAVRLIMAPLLTYEYDAYHWGVIMQNINSGNGLYELTGYFYLPVWGYIMGFIDMIWNTFLSVDVFGVSVTELFPMCDLEHIWHLSTITSPEFNTAIKIPLIIVDLIVGYLVHKTVFEITSDRRKADIAFGLWYLCPIVAYMSGSQAMFDNISALFLLLCIIFVRKDRYFLAGVFLSLATLLKLFPLVCALILVLYVIRKYPEKKETVRRLILAVLGFAVTAAVIMLPNILEGNIESTLTLITDRGSRNTLYSIVTIGAAVILELLIAHRFFREEGNPDTLLLKYIPCAMVISFIMGLNPQYVIVIIPFLAINICTSDRTYTLCWWIIGCASMLSALIQDNFSILSSVSTFWGWVSPEWIVDTMVAFETKILGIPLMFYFNDFFTVMEYVGVASVVLLMFRKEIAGKWPKIGKAIDKITSHWKEDEQNA